MVEYHKYFEENSIGNPHRIIINDKLMSLSRIEFSFILTHLTPHLEKCKIVVEIGSGYGGLAELVKKTFPEIKYILLDLPEANAIQTYYLAKCFPRAKIRFFEHFMNFENIDFRKIDFDFAILPGSLIKNCTNNSVDMFINTRSMMEMPPDILSFYFSHIHRTIKKDGSFYCLNRYEKLTKFKYYPFDNYWDVRLSSEWPITIDANPHHELLTVRVNERNRSVKRVQRSFPPTSTLFKNRFTYILKNWLKYYMKPWVNNTLPQPIIELLSRLYSVVDKERNYFGPV